MPATVLIPCLLFSACSRKDPKPADADKAPLVVRVVRLESRPLEESLDITGSLVSSVAVDVKTEFAGRVVSALKQEGDRVSKGELLVQLDDLNARLSVSQARANLEVAQAALDRSRLVEDHARTEQERAQNLLKSGGITDRDFQAAQMTARDAGAQVRLAEAQLKQSQEVLAMAEKRWGDCRIYSPITGEVEGKYLNPGSWADGNALLYRLVDNRRLELEAYVASTEIARLALRQKIRFNVPGFPGEEFDASIFAISPAVQPQNRSVTVRAQVPNATGKLKAGMFVQGKILTGLKPAALVVPLNAVWRRMGQRPFVFVVEENRARRREVNLGMEQSQSVEVTAGLTAGDVVVADQDPELGDGVKVTLQP